MKLTPIDIRKWEFKKSVRGYDVTDVSAFLELAAEEFERLLHEKREFEQKCKRLDADIEEYKRVEKSLQDTLISAKETTDRSLEHSRKEAELIISDAELKAEKIIDGARKKISRIQDEITRLKVQKNAFVARLRSVLTSQLELVKVLGDEEPDETLTEDLVDDMLETKKTRAQRIVSPDRTKPEMKGKSSSPRANLTVDKTS